jgi:hypothetical protein
MRKLIFLVITLFFMLIALAAENDPQDPVENEAAAEPELVPAEPGLEPIQDNEEEDIVLADIEAEEQTSRRFIPTEQISQDLGVSFPVDI